MLTSALLASLAALALATLPSSEPVEFACGNALPSKEFLETSSKLRAAEHSLTSQGELAAAEIVIDTHVHIVAANNTADSGYASREAIHDQMDALNKGFASSGIRFVLKSLDHTINATWSSGVEEEAMKKALRKGRYRDLNLYFSKQPMGRFGVLGYCTLPQWAPRGSDAFDSDGCIVSVDTLPGGAFRGYDTGKTAVHEVGHWLGLLHTFQDGCYGAGDYVDDTPAQGYPTWGCPVGERLDTCPEQPGLDPIHNYMDYRVDVCVWEFTVGQVNRMKSFWELYRRGT
ncbi:metalloprotease MEP1 [Metarhizium guizhouense ARSEF 977]|uniref:Metalloprotease MEP1 n=1 Tax=Metarhizium guizhouense (strain ARSEF 977) TaxID=1276136 RepID=A0A0B4H7A5_METGA|nr:metalloprotease MEP1 [Metarhizium guizhouense ARSEF 977]